MNRRRLNHPISVDSETGEYWNGQNALKTQAQINSFIKPSSKTRSNGYFDVARVRALIEWVVVRIMLLIVVYFEVNSFGLM